MTEQQQEVRIEDKPVVTVLNGLGAFCLGCFSENALFSSVFDMFLAPGFLAYSSVFDMFLAPGFLAYSKGQCGCES